jgi:hypothetical protein
MDFTLGEELLFFREAVAAGGRLVSLSLDAPTFSPPPPFTMQGSRKSHQEVDADEAFLQHFTGGRTGVCRGDLAAGAETVTASRVRLHILASSSEAHIREFQLFQLGL